MSAFVNPYVWTPNEPITADKLNKQGAAVTTYINGGNIDTPQLACKYSDVFWPAWMEGDTGGPLAANLIRFGFFTPPASNYDLILTKFAVTVANFAGVPSGTVTADIINVATGLSALSGAAPVASVNATEVANTNSVTLLSNQQYLFKITYKGTGTESYQGVYVMLYGKVLLRA